jgi:hypothetical protein
MKKPFNLNDRLLFDISTMTEAYVDKIFSRKFFKLQTDYCVVVEYGDDDVYTMECDSLEDAERYIRVLEAKLKLMKEKI